MSDFKAKMHQIQFRLGLRPRPRWGAYSAPPDHLAGFKGSTSKGRDGRGRGEGGEGRVRKKERGGRGKGKGRRKRSPCSDITIWPLPSPTTVTKF